MRRISIQTPPQGCDYVAIKDFWQAADQLGFHAGYTFDHLVPIPVGDGPAHQSPGERTGGQLDGWITATALAAATNNLKVGTLVTDVTLRAPALLAKMAVSLDHVSGGRAILGVGAGWHRAEHRMFGIEFFEPAERVDRLDESLQIFRMLMGDSGPTSFQGRHFALEDTYFEPKAFGSHIPVLVGGSSKRVRRIAAEHADIVNGFAPAADWPRLNDELDALLAAAGRRPGDVTRSAYVFAEISTDQNRERALIDVVAQRNGIPADVAASRVVLSDPGHNLRVLEDLFAAGVDEVVLGLTAPYSAADLDRFAREILASSPAPTPPYLNSRSPRG